MRHLHQQKYGFTLIEMSMACLLSVLLGAVVFYTLRTGTALSAKNASLNRSHDDLRSALDRLANNVRMARNVPTLLNTSGAVVTTGPAAGIRYDRIIGEPYVLEPAMTQGSISSSATSISVYRTTVGGAPPIPSVNDLFLVDTPGGTIRARITAVSLGGAGGSTQRITLTFASAVGKSLTWGANQPQWGRLVRQEAFLVMPTTGGRNELRFYPSFDPMPSLGDKAKYAVITTNIGSNAGEATPFTVVDVNGDKVLQANVRVQQRDHNRWLADKQGNEMNTYFRMNLSLTSRLRPKTTN
jgi:hypothetical protein